MYEDENNLYHYSYRKGDEQNPNAPIDTKNYAEDPWDKSPNGGSPKKKGGSGYLFRTSTVQDFSGVTGACLLVKTAVYDEMHGLDEQFAVAFNDVDFCLRVRDAGYRIAWTPYAELIHYESKSRGGDEKDPVKAARFAAEQQRLYTIHGKENILDDPYYNPSLSRDREDFSESDDLRRLKEGRVTVRFRGGTLQ